jgi:prevent-host-death family protein
MKTVNVHEAKTHFSKLLRRVAAGEVIAIANRGVPVARLSPAPSSKPLRGLLGSESGRMIVAADFDAPLPASVLEGFLGGKKKRKAKRQ